MPSNQRWFYSNFGIWTFSFLCAALPRVPAFRSGTNALISNDRVEPFQFDDEHFWFWASEFHRGKIGLVDYLLYPANGNIMVLPRILFLGWRSVDWIETRFLLGILPGTIALSLTTFLLTKLLLEIRNSVPEALGLALVFAYSLHSQDFFSGLAMNGFFLFLFPVLVWLALKHVKDSPISIQIVIVLGLLPLLFEGRQVVLTLLIALFLAYSPPRTHLVRRRLLFATLLSMTSTVAVRLAARLFGDSSASFEQPDYGGYQQVSLLQGLWVSVRAHSSHIFWVWTNARSSTFVTLGGSDPIPSYGAYMSFLIILLFAVTASAIAIRRTVGQFSGWDSRYSVLAFCVLASGGFILATAVGRSRFGWDWNATRYSPYAAVTAVLVIGVLLRLSSARGWRILGDTTIGVLVAIQIARLWESLRYSDTENKLVDQGATWASLVLVGAVFILLLTEVTRELESESSLRLEPPGDGVGQPLRP